MTSQRIFLDDDSNNRSPKQSTIEQIRLRQKLKLLMDPYKDIMTLFLRKWYSNKCGKDDRKCTPCYTFLRRYHELDITGNIYVKGIPGLLETTGRDLDRSQIIFGVPTTYKC